MKVVCYIFFPAVLQSLFENLREAQARQDVRAIVVTGAQGMTTKSLKYTICIYICLVQDG